MAVIAMCSAKGSPGVTVTALACTLTWNRRLILAECDPAGGDLAAGYLREVPLGERGLAHLTAALHRRRLAEDLWTQLVDLAPGRSTALTRLALPGLTDPGQAAGVAVAWPHLSELFHSLATGPNGYDVIVDCGRLNAAHPPTPIVAGADLVLLVLRPNLPSIRAGAAALAALHRDRVDRVALALIGDGPYTAKEVALELRTPMVAALADDPDTAAVLSNGGERHRGRLLRAAARAEQSVFELVATTRAAQHPTPPGTAPGTAPATVSEVRSVR